VIYTHDESSVQRPETASSSSGSNMEAIGTTAALAQLLGFSIQVSKAARSLVQSFLNAPKELVELTSKLDLLHSHIKQLHSLGNELSGSDLLTLLPPEYQTMLLMGIQTNFHMLQMIQSLCNSRLGKSQRIATRLRWATLDKKKAGRILGKVTKAESELNIVLAILGVPVLPSLFHFTLSPPIPLPSYPPPF
jgi:hypothetical protein